MKPTKDTPNDNNNSMFCLKNMGCCGPGLTLGSHLSMAWYYPCCHWTVTPQELLRTPSHGPPAPNMVTRLHPRVIYKVLQDAKSVCDHRISHKTCNVHIRCKNTRTPVQQWDNHYHSWCKKLTSFAQKVWNSWMHSLLSLQLAFLFSISCKLHLFVDIYHCFFFLDALARVMHI